MKIIFYSYSKNLRSLKVARAFSELNNDELFAIALKDKQPSVKTMFEIMAKQLQGKQVDITADFDIKDDTHICIVSCIWAGQIHPCMKTYIENTDLSGKTVDIIVTSRSDSKKYIDDFEKIITSKNAIVGKKLLISNDTDVDNTTKLKETLIKFTQLNLDK